MAKRHPVLLVLHPKQWAQESYRELTGLDVHHVSIGGAVPKKRSGVPTFDGYAEVVTKEGLRDLYAATRKYKPDFLLFWLHAGLYGEHLDEVRKEHPKMRMLFWFGNHRTNLSGGVTRIAKYLSALFLNSTEPSQFKLYTDFGIKRVGTLWDGFDPDEVPLEEVAPTHDCFFAGESYLYAQNRNEVFRFPGTDLRRDFIIRVAKRFNLACHAARHESWPFPVLKEVYHPHHTAAMRKAKITLNINHFPSFRQAYTRRTIRSIFARRCHLTYYIPGMEEHFENHKHLVWFHSLDEGIELIDRYLKDDAARERIAFDGWKLACEKFTFKVRLQEFEKTLRRFFPEAFK
jgi:hypothetical protein